MERSSRSAFDRRRARCARTTGSCSQERQLLAASRSSNDELGTAVAIDAERGLVVDGVPHENALDSGAVYVFR
jgi:hypothetical protein